MQIIFDESGKARTIYTEAIDLYTLGKFRHRRASYVEPTETGEWMADLSPVGGPILGPFSKRSDAIREEMNTLNKMLHFA